MNQNLPLDEIANRIIDAILEERHINRESLSLRIRPILKIWLKQTDAAITSNRKKHASKDKLQWTIEKRGMEIEFWLNEIRRLTNEDQMKEYYAKINKERILQGYHTYEEE